MECRQLHQESDRYADSVLLDLEHNLGGMIKVIQNGRKHLQVKSSTQKAQQQADAAPTSEPNKS